MPLINKGYLVQGEHSAVDDDIKAWREKTPSFQNWDPDWFSKEIASTGDFVADDSDLYCSSSGSVLLFATRETAEKYGERDAAIASGIRNITPCYYVDLSPTICNFSEEQRDDFSLSDIEGGQDGIIAVFYEANIVMGEKSPKGYDVLQRVVDQVTEMSEG